MQQIQNIEQEKKFTEWQMYQQQKINEVWKELSNIWFLKNKLIAENQIRERKIFQLREEKKSIEISYSEFRNKYDVNLFNDSIKNWQYWYIQYEFFIKLETINKEIEKETNIINEWKNMYNHLCAYENRIMNNVHNI